MELLDIKFAEKEIDGKYYIQPIEKMNVNQFQEILKIVKANGGVYSRNNGFVFEKKVEIKIDAPKPEPKKIITAKEVKVKKDVKELNKPENKVKEKDVPKGVEFEVYQPISLEECCEFVKKLLAKEEFKSHDHQELIKRIFIRCKDDEELRANLIHKDYKKMWTAGGFAWAKRNKITSNFACTPLDILEDVIAEYKKPVMKAPKKVAENKTKTKKTTKKKGVAKK